MYFKNNFKLSIILIDIKEVLKEMANSKDSNT